MAKRIPKTGPLSIQCPRCNAVPGNTCRTPIGRPAQIHSARRNPQAPPPAHRPTALTPELTEQVAANLRLGAPLNMAVAAAGIHIATAYRWLAQADADDPDEPSPHRDFRDAITQARARGGINQLMRINQAAARHLRSEKPVVNPTTGAVLTDGDGNVLYERVWEQDWRAAGFVLERSFARDFGRREVVELSAGDGVEPGAAASVPGSSGAGIERVATNIAAFRARKELEAGAAVGGDGQPIEDAELVDDA